MQISVWLLFPSAFSAFCISTGFQSTTHSGAWSPPVVWVVLGDVVFTSRNVRSCVCWCCGSSVSVSDVRVMYYTFLIECDSWMIEWPQKCFLWPPAVSLEVDNHFLPFSEDDFPSVMLFYDVILTFDEEVEWIWKQRFTPVTLLYYMVSTVRLTPKLSKLFALEPIFVAPRIHRHHRL